MQVLMRYGISDAHTFRVWAMKNHPDKGGCVKHFQEINGLYDKYIKNKSTSEPKTTNSTFNSEPKSTKPTQSTFNSEPKPTKPTNSTFNFERFFTPDFQSFFGPEFQKFNQHFESFKQTKQEPTVNKCEKCKGEYTNYSEHLQSTYHKENTYVNCKCGIKVKESLYTAHKNLMNIKFHLVFLTVIVVEHIEQILKNST